MIGIKNENRVHHSDFPGLRDLAAQLVKKISRQRKVRLLWQRIFAMLNPITVGDQRRNFCDQPDRFANVCLV